MKDVREAPKTVSFQLVMKANVLNPDNHNHNRKTETAVITAPPNEGVKAEAVAVKQEETTAIDIDLRREHRICYAARNANIPVLNLISNALFPLRVPLLKFKRCVVSSMTWTRRPNESTS
jgi:hypothetical protein